MNDTASITHAVVAASSADEYDNVTIAAVAVSVDDDDTAAVTVSESSLTVAEGANKTYTVVLNTQPASDVVISVARSGSGDVSVSPASLTFTSSNWDTAQTVTVAAAQDADTVNDTASIAHAVVAASSADEYDVVAIAAVAVSVDDDDTAAVTLSESSVTVAEGGNKTYTVVLNTQPASDVVINVTKSGSPDVSASPATLTFTTSNWGTAQTVTVAAAQDADTVNDTASITHAVVAASSADEYDGVAIASVAVSVTDDDTAAVTVSETAVSVTEGGNNTYTVVLNTQPSANVVINVTKSGSPDVTVSPATLTFTTSNWDTAQTVTVAAAQDADTVNDTASITHAVVAASSADEYDNVTIAAVAVSVTDDDTAAVTVSETAVSVTEGGNKTYTVVLNTQPSANVVINVTKSGSPDVTASPATLTFTSSNWDTAQTVTVAAAQDADTVNDTASITHAVVAASSADEYDNVTIAAVAVSVTDDDTAAVTVSESALSVTEGGNNIYTVVLNTQPASDVVIAVSSDNTDVAVSPATLTFTSSDWDTAQTVTVAAAHDADAVNDTASIAHTVVAARSADEYDNAAIASVTVSVTDDDAGVTVSESTLSVVEGASATYTVVLDALPASDVVISVTISDNTDVAVDTDDATSGNQTTLTFTTSNWGTAQTVTVAAAQDADTVNDTASITHAVVAASSADEYDAVAIASVAVSVTDDDTAAVTVSETAVSVTEGGNKTYTVVLNTQPASDVVIAVSSDNTDVTASPATLTFTTSNWDTAQTVTVAAAHDADAVNDTASIAHTVVAARSADEYDNAAIASVTVSVTDDDTAAVTVSESALSVTEGANNTYTVVLDTQPASDVVIAVSSDNTDVAVSPATLTFTSSDWDTAQTVTVRAAQDADAVNDTASITHTVNASRSADEYDGVAIASVTVSVADDDAGVTVSESTLSVVEGASATYTVVLDALPASDVVISVTSSDNTDVAVDTDDATSGNQTTLTFTTSNWGTAQTVTVAAAQDADAVNESASITHAVVAAESADEFDSVTVASVSLTVDDDDAAVSVSETALSVTEGANKTYTVVLDALPASDVVIAVSSDNTDVAVSPATLTFTTSNWDTAQTVTVVAAQDADAVNDTASISHTVNASRSADEYDGVAIAAVGVSVTDDDTASVTVSETTVSVAEGANNTYTVVLKTQPSADVVISVASSGSPDVSVSPATLTFTSSNWDTVQTVTVAAAQDADAVNDTASITHTVNALQSADEYDNVTIAAVTVSVTDDDDDTAAVTVSESALTVTEGAHNTYTVVLDALPASDVVINVTKSGSPDVTASPATLTFTSSNWDTAQTVTVAVDQDADTVNDTASITHAVVAARSADEYDNVTIAAVAVSVTDDDTAAVTVSASALTVTEGTNNTYTVVLDAQPSGNVVISVTRSGSSDVTASPATLTFTTSNWDTAQTVTVAAAQDSDAANDTASIAHTVVDASSADEFDLVTVAGVTVTVADDDARLVLDVRDLSMNEGRSNTAYDVKLGGQPTGNVVVRVTVSGSSDVAVDTDGRTAGDQNTLTFTNGNWDTGQLVRVRAAEDADAVDDEATITHAVVDASSADEFDTAPDAVRLVTVVDDDAAVTVSEATLTVDEGGSGTYTVVLDAQPASDVVITVNSDNTDVAVSPAKLTFTTANWSTAQTVTVAAAEDADAANDAASITHAVVAAESADEFDLVTVAGVTVTVDDDDAAVTVSEATLAVDEGGSGTYTVVLDAQPASDVVITVNSDNTDVAVSPAKLTFTTANWSTAQTVTVRAAQDADAVGDAASITHVVVAAGSADAFDGVAIAGLSVAVTDDDFSTLVVDATLFKIKEGSRNAGYFVKLSAQPTGNVVVRVTVSGSSDVAVDTDGSAAGDQDTLTISRGNWDTGQLVRVRAAQDADAVNDTASIAHAVVAAESADEFDAAPNVDLPVAVADDDAGVTVSETTLSVVEGASATYTVVLDALPASDVVINVARSGSPDVSVDTDDATSGNQTTLTFTTSNWGTAQTVTVAAAHDADAVNDTASITHAVVAAGSADEFDSVTVASVSLTVDDDDAAVTVSASTLSVVEGASKPLTQWSWMPCPLLMW